MLNSFPILLSSGVALGGAAVAVGVVGVPATLLGVLFGNHKKRVRLYMMAVLAVTFATSAGLLVGGTLVRSAALPWWGVIPLSLAAFALVANVYAMHEHLRQIDAEGDERTLGQRSLDGLMMDALSNLPAFALLWVTLAN